MYLYCMDDTTHYLDSRSYKVTQTNKKVTLSTWKQGCEAIHSHLLLILWHTGSSPVVATAIFFSTQQPEPISAAYTLKEYRVEKFLGRGKAALFKIDGSRII